MTEYKAAVESADGFSAFEIEGHFDNANTLGEAWAYFISRQQPVDGSMEPLVTLFTVEEAKQIIQAIQGWVDWTEASNEPA